jgi:hypothetical protein
MHTLPSGQVCSVHRASLIIPASLTVPLLAAGCPMQCAHSTTSPAPKRLMGSPWHVPSLEPNPDPVSADSRSSVMAVRCEPAAWSRPCVRLRCCYHGNSCVATPAKHTAWMRKAWQAVLQGAVSSGRPHSIRRGASSQLTGARRLCRLRGRPIEQALAESGQPASDSGASGLECYLRTARIRIGR